MSKDGPNTNLAGDDDSKVKPGSPEAPVPHPLTPEANVPAAPGEISDPENASEVADVDQEGNEVESNQPDDSDED